MFQQLSTPELDLLTLSNVVTKGLGRATLWLTELHSQIKYEATTF
jgi:hypothetical protein